MAYYVDLSQISIDRYKDILRSADLIPSWMILKENIDQNLDAIKHQSIKNLDELQKALKTKAKVQEFAKKSGLPEDYVTVLRRVINGYTPKPNRIVDFPEVPSDIVDRLKTIGIKNTLELYDRVLTPEKRNKLVSETAIDEAMVLKLTKLTDLSRIRWVNHTFANVLLEAGFDSVEKVARASYEEMYTTIKKLNEEKKLYKGNIGAHDMKMVVELAQELDLDVLY